MSFKPPRVALGSTVLWKHSTASPDPAAAIVTRVSPDAISVLIFPTESRAGIPKDAVRHADDPANDTLISDAGVWEQTEDAKLLASVLVLGAGTTKGNSKPAA